MAMRVRILGCGSSGGVPRVGGDWGACDPSDPFNRRRRCSILLEVPGATTDGAATAVLVDTSPDLREQLLSAEVTNLDAVMFTHEHADHTHGIDDLRPLVIHRHARLDSYMGETTARVLKARFAYVFETPKGSDYPPLLNDHRIAHAVETTIAGRGGSLTVTPYAVEHGGTDTFGLRVGAFAYVPDINGIPPGSEALFEGLDLLVIDALRYRRHPSHFSLDETLAVIERFKPARAILTNLHTDLDHATLAASLPAGIVPAYDGMCVEV